MLVLSYAVGLVPFDPERVVALRGLDSVTFKRPVPIGDTIRVRSRVEAVRAARRRARAGHARLAGPQPATTASVARARVEALWRAEPVDDERRRPEPEDRLREQVLL